jgi:hypothetical protein
MDCIITSSLLLSLLSLSSILQSMEMDTRTTREMYIMEIGYTSPSREKYTVHVELFDGDKEIIEREETLLEFQEFCSELKIHFIKEGCEWVIEPPYSLVNCAKLATLLSENPWHETKQFNIQPLYRPTAACTGILHTLTLDDN